ncbi:MAG: hypothetical protein V3R82_05680, partial [Candidatus Hydrothermarchaeales archaeon]
SEKIYMSMNQGLYRIRMELKNALLLFLVLITLGLSTVHAQAGLYVSQHNITYRLFENNFQVEEKIVFENTGDSVFTVQRYVKLERGNTSNIEVEGIAEKNIQVYDSEYPTIIQWYMEVNKGAAKEVTIRYSRTDGLSEQDHIKIFKSNTLGRYSWETTQATIKFITPPGYQFGNIIPPVPKKIVDNKEETTYRLILPYDKIFLTYGLPVEIEYAKFKELSFAKMDVARGKITDAKRNIDRANDTIENSRGYDANLTESLGLYNQSLQILNATEKEMILAEAAYSSSASEYYTAYVHATNAESLANNASEKAAKAEQKANFEVQNVLNKKILALTTIMTPMPTETAPPTITTPPPTTTQPPTSPTPTTQPPQTRTEAPPISPTTKSKRSIIWYLTLAVIIIGVGGFILKKEKPSGRRGEVRDFRVINDLKRKKFRGFDEQVDKVKKEVELASKIRKLRRKRDELESHINEIKEKRMADEISKDAFVAEKNGLEGSITDIDLKLRPLEDKLDEIKRVK